MQVIYLSSFVKIVALFAVEITAESAKIFHHNPDQKIYLQSEQKILATFTVKHLTKIKSGTQKIELSPTIQNSFPSLR